MITKSENKSVTRTVSKTVETREDLLAAARTNRRQTPQCRRLHRLFAAASCPECRMEIPPGGFTSEEYHVYFAVELPPEVDPQQRAEAAVPRDEIDAAEAALAAARNEVATAQREMTQADAVAQEAAYERDHVMSISMNPFSDGDRKRSEKAAQASVAYEEARGRWLKARDAEGEANTRRRIAEARREAELRKRIPA